MTSRLIIALIASVSLIGCTSMRAVDTSDTEFTQQLELGDHLVVYEKGGRIVDMTFTEVDGDLLRGSLHKYPLDTVEVEIADIKKIEIEKVSAGKTTAAVVGLIVLAPIAALGAGLGAAGY